MEFSEIARAWCCKRAGGAANYYRLIKVSAARRKSFRAPSVVRLSSMAV